MASSKREEQNRSDSNGAPRIGVFVCHCGTNIAGSVDIKRVVEEASKLSNVVIASDYRYLCSDPGQALIKQSIKEFNLNKVVVAACTPTLHELTFSRCVEDAGLNRYLLTIANIREQCSWAHSHQPEEATKKAIDTIRMAVARASLLEPLEVRKVPIRKSCLVIGGGIAGIQAALDLANEGFDVYLVEKSPSIGGHMAQFDKTFPTMDCSLCILSPKMAEVGHHEKIKLLTNSEVIDVKG
ncbi:MAG: FAD-dependent oxidoreductase, partial [Candidatus Bathyarchaeia archaeon]